MDLTIQTRMFNNVNHREVCLKLGYTCFTTLAMLELETKAIICSTIKENLILYCRTFSAFVVAVSTYFNNVCLTKKLPLQKKSKSLQ